MSFIDQCGYDQAGIPLQHIYGALNPPNRGPLSGTMLRFDQSVYARLHDTSSLSLGDTGFVFVPRDCADGQPCRIHIALHGCKQDIGDIDRKFIDDTGYNSWADTNHLIVLYPQTMTSSFAPFNPQACWDWWSYVNHEDSYVTKSGVQIRAIKAMLDALTASAVPVTAAATPGDAAPTALAVVDTSDTGADVVWNPVGGASAYRVSRRGRRSVRSDRRCCGAELRGFRAETPRGLSLARRGCRQWRGRSSLDRGHGQHTIDAGAVRQPGHLPDWQVIAISVCLTK